MPRRTRMTMRSSLVPTLVVTLAGTIAGADEPADTRVSFSRDIRPILSDACYQCHGPDKNQRKADLRLDLRQDLYETPDGRTLVVPGKLDESELYARLIETDPEARMPPPKSARQLSPGEINLIRRWIAQGGQWQGHWAYVLPERPVVPDVADDHSFVVNDVDRFILRRLRDRRLAPSANSDRPTLIRRLSFDLTGLPPTPDEVADFVSDRAENAYERLVDRLLMSPQFGERMAMFWLDLVRYADTCGYHGDNHEDRDLYRDWVIRSFNENLPFDRFTIDQLAGDLCADPTDDQRIASGYNRLLMTTREGGAQAKEYLAKYSADRVRNFSAVWLAGTMGCCECHDHKYDPFSMRDFYSLAAFFADIQETAIGEQRGTKFPTPDEAARLAAFDAQIAPLKEIVDTQTAELELAQAAWEQSLSNRQIEWTHITPVDLKSALGATLANQPDGTILATDENPDRDTYELTFRLPLKEVTAIRLEVLPHESLSREGPGRSENGNFALSEFEAVVDGKPVNWSGASATYAQNDSPINVAIDGNIDTGWSVYGRLGQPHQAFFELKDDLGSDNDSLLVISMQQSFGFQHTIGHFQFAVTKAPRPVRAEGLSAVPLAIAQIVKTTPADRSEKQKQELSAYYRTITPLLEAPRNELAKLKGQREDLLGKVKTTLVSMSGPPRPIRVLPRGNWLDDSGEIVQPGAPAFLSTTQPAADGGRLTRLDLARWLVAPQNPLTARVFVNRLWRIAFGQGLVRSVEDFGAQGTPPTHPDLLDWLALEFASPATSSSQAAPQPVAWDVKRIVKLLVMSGTYRQSSLADESLRQRDPYNQWLARQGRYRLDAETVRDNALAVSGLLVRRLGGASVRPYQPGGYWAYLNFPPREWKNDAGDGLYRRGLYTYWCRTFLHPSLKAFDAPTREECNADRPRSNTPLQALALLNDPSYVEAARAFAERVLREGGSDVPARLDYAYIQALSRKPRPEEITLLSALYQKHLGQYQSDGKAADESLKVGDRPAPSDLNAAEFAAWTSVARALFNLHEMVTRN
ncbi:MAG: PSD1 and planctomycete cytochrome C domain-containing protein [Planctomycetaceae bacterium]